LTLATLVRSKRGSRGMVRLALALAGVVGITLLTGQGGTASTAHAAPGLYYRAGYSVQGTWLCYGWSNGAYHCTQHWAVRDGHYVSYNPAWVPNYAQGVARMATTTVRRAAPVQRVASGAGSHVGVTYSATPGAIGPWVYTGHPAYGMSDFAGDPYGGYFGNCTWYAWYRHQNEPLMQLGNAAQWAYNARAHGLTVTSTPVVGSTVVFQPGVQGASPEGHVAHVEAVYANGWFLVSEMSFYWNGGGFGRVSYRYAHVGAGVSFIL